MRTGGGAAAPRGRKMFSVDSCQFTLGPCHFFDTLLFRPLRRMRTSPAGRVQPEESAYDRGVGTMERRIPFPQFLLNHGRVNLHYASLLVVDVPESRRVGAVFKIHNIREYPCQFDRGSMNE